MPVRPYLRKRHVAGRGRGRAPTPLVARQETCCTCWPIPPWPSCQAGVVRVRTRRPGRSTSNRIGRIRARTAYLYLPLHAQAAPCRRRPPPHEVPGRSRPHPVPHRGVHPRPPHPPAALDPRIQPGRLTPVLHPATSHPPAGIPEPTSGTCSGTALKPRQRVHFWLRNSVAAINGYTTDALCERLESAGTAPCPFRRCSQSTFVGAPFFVLGQLRAVIPSATVSGRPVRGGVRIRR